ncbi:MAG: polyisoprenoid-binding protein [Candidatus Zixiibacteriota bacterium]|nr:MAG: polyisoprenoid-binding protein [candidate division Zixibacteria bacterium]
MLKRVFVLFSAVFTLSASTWADVWNIDKPHTSVGFTVRHMVVTKVHGQFKDFDGEIEFDGKNVETGLANITIRMASIDTENQKRDDHLKSADFFDVEKFPMMSFKSKKMIKGEGDNFKITGDLTIKDVTKEVTLDAVFNGTIKDPWGGTRAGFSATGKINRQDFGVKWNQALETGGFLVGDEVTINIETELIKGE